MPVLGYFLDEDPRDGDGVGAAGHGEDCGVVGGQPLMSGQRLSDEVNREGQTNSSVVCSEFTVYILQLTKYYCQLLPYCYCHLLQCKTG